jgi:hypothetical protein
LSKCELPASDEFQHIEDACALAAVPGTSVNLECVRHFLFSGSVTFSSATRPDEMLMNAFLKTPKLLRRSALVTGIEDAIMGDKDASATAVL